MPQDPLKTPNRRRRYVGTEQINFGRFGLITPNDVLLFSDAELFDIADDPRFVELE